MQGLPGQGPENNFSSGRVLRKKNIKIENSESDSDFEQEMGEMQQEIELPTVFGVSIESFHSFIVEKGKRMFYVKFAGKSFKKCKWLSEEEILQIDPMAKGKLS